jgi:hypothetical protein
MAPAGEPEGHTKFFSHPRLRNAAAVEFAMQEEVKRAGVSFDYFENHAIFS